ncbi:MAG: hypothetical protein PHV37_03310 [Candidatus Gastranaerophilales bacterium]|nr:hypothetical protein [Candidatus Gastranaerophilales bacterium]
MNFSKLLSSICLSIVLLITSTGSANAVINKKINADIGTKRIPQGTYLNIKLIDPIDSSTLKMGDQVDFMIVEDVKVDKKIVLPVGSVIRGSVQSINSAKMLSKGATIYVGFDHVMSTTGKQVPLKVGICNNKYLTYDGGLSSKTNYGTATKQNLDNTAKIVKVSTKWGWNTGSQVLEGYPKYVLAPISSIVSIPAAGLYFLGDSVVDVFKKGDNVLINQGEILKVMLLKPLDMPMY